MPCIYIFFVYVENYKLKACERLHVCNMYHLSIPKTKKMFHLFICNLLLYDGIHVCGKVKAGLKFIKIAENKVYNIEIFWAQNKENKSEIAFLIPEVGLVLMRT